MMLDSFSHPLAFLNLQPWSVAILVPLAGMIFAGVVIVTGKYFANRRREMWHQTVRLALEKGQPLPTLPEDDLERHGQEKRSNSAANDIRAGLIAMATGVGLYVFLGAVASSEVGYVGAIPGFIGVALLLSGLGRLLFAKKESGSDSRPPQS